MVIKDFLSFGYCDALKDGLARTVKVFRNGARTSLLLSTGVPSMQTWPIIRPPIATLFLSTGCLSGLQILQSHNNKSKSQPCSKTNKECMGIIMTIKFTPVSNSNEHCIISTNYQPLPDNATSFLLDSQLSSTGHSPVNNLF